MAVPSLDELKERGTARSLILYSIMYMQDADALYILESVATSSLSIKHNLESFGEGKDGGVPSQIQCTCTCMQQQHDLSHVL